MQCIIAAMLRLRQIQLVQFRNHPQRQYAFQKKVIGICGPNGIGKTNLLDAVYFLCFTKSYFAASDAALVMQGAAGFRAEGLFETETGKAKVVTVLRENGRKECSWNEESYSRMAQHIGRLPAVMIAPDDVELITGGSETRRRLIDGLLCQLNAQYLQQLMDYNKLLQQRNSLLKQMAETGNRDQSLLQVIDEQLTARAVFIAAERRHLLQAFLPQAENHYNMIAGEAKEPVALSYQSSLVSTSDIVADQEAFLQQLKQALPKDYALQRTTCGIHRDDIVLHLKGQPFRQIASQGQRKSLLFALKLTEYEWLEKQKGFAPLLLLDDVFEKLDNQRMNNLLREVCVEKSGQVFITDTHKERLEKSLKEIGADFEVIDLNP
jgi:DNA replication and repair protein RecF